MLRPVGARGYVCVCQNGFKNICQPDMVPRNTCLEIAPAQALGAMSMMLPYFCSCSFTP